MPRHDRRPGLDASMALAVAESHHDRRAAALVASSIRAYGPARDRRRASKLLRKLQMNLRADAEPVPGLWMSLGEVTPLRALSMTDRSRGRRVVGRIGLPFRHGVLRRRPAVLEPSENRDFRVHPDPRQDGLRRRVARLGRDFVPRVASMRRAATRSRR